MHCTAARTAVELDGTGRTALVPESGRSDGRLQCRTQLALGPATQPVLQLLASVLQAARRNFLICVRIDSMERRPVERASTDDARAGEPRSSFAGKRLGLRARSVIMAALAETPAPPTTTTITDVTARATNAAATVPPATVAPATQPKAGPSGATPPSATAPGPARPPAPPRPRPSPGAPRAPARRAPRDPAARRRPASSSPRGPVGTAPTAPSPTLKVRSYRTCPH